MYEIKLSDKDDTQQLIVSKSSFLDTKANNKKEAILEIENVCTNVFSFEGKSLKHINSSNSILLDNGILLINKVIEEIKNNYLIFLRSKYPILFNKKLGIYNDIIFTLFTPKCLKTSSKLQLLSKISLILKKKTIRSKIIGANKAEDIIALFIKS